MLRRVRHGGYQALLDDLAGLTDAVNEADDGTVRYASEYLLVTASRGATGASTLSV